LKEEANVGVVIVAAGESRRMKGVDKQFALLGSLPVVVRTVNTFQSLPEVRQIILVTNQAGLESFRELKVKWGWTIVTAVIGGPKRQDSVWSGLQALDPCDWVIVHDGARPLVTENLIQRGLAVAEEFGSAVAAVPLKDTVKAVGPDNLVSETPDRSQLFAIQTPQIFRYENLIGAYKAIEGTTEEFPDDAAVVERTGQSVKIFEGDQANIKITTPEDLVVAEALLKSLNLG